MCDCVRIVQFEGFLLRGLSETIYKLQVKKVLISIGPLKIYRWKTVDAFLSFALAMWRAEELSKHLSNRLQP